MAPSGGRKGGGSDGSRAAVAGGSNTDLAVMGRAVQQRMNRGAERG
jgi:hypothetical protein